MVAGTTERMTLRLGKRNTDNEVYSLLNVEWYLCGFGFFVRVINTTEARLILLISR